MSSTDPDFGGGIDVATGATWAILSGCIRMSSRTGHVQQALQHAPGVEMLARQVGGGARMTVVIGVDAIDAGDGLLEAGEREKPFAVRQVRGPAGVLHERRPSRREIALGPIAEPPGPRRHVG